MLRTICFEKFDNDEGSESEGDVVNMAEFKVGQPYT